MYNKAIIKLKTTPGKLLLSITFKKEKETLFFSHFFKPLRNFNEKIAFKQKDTVTIYFSLISVATVGCLASDCRVSFFLWGYSKGVISGDTF